ncbi:MAG TPA: DNA polymerase I [Anaerolineaceae bacterium]|nr:DNA polymerase I [Anaerolineaceae bacterium]
MPPILDLIDGHALAYRTYYALMAAGGDRFKTHSGEPTAGTYGFASVLLRILEQERPEYLAVAFDTGKTFRDDLYPAYKATRAKMPDDLRPQIERIRQMVDAFQIPRLEMEGFEADDVLGSVAHQAVAKGLGVKIITGDRDLLQLVENRIIVSLSGNKLSEAKDFTAEEVVSYMGVRPDQIVDYKALVGDTSDNIPGVQGIGEKTAVSLLSQYQTLDDIYASLTELPTRVRSRLEAGKAMAYLSRDLATIRTDLKITLDLDQARTDRINIPQAEDLFRQLEFRSLIPRLHNSVARSNQAEAPGGQLSLFGEQVKRIGEPSPPDLKVHVVNSEEALHQLQQRLEKVEAIALDTETTSTDPIRADLVGISLAIEPGEGFYIPVGHQDGSPQLPLQQIVEALMPALTNPRQSKIGHNLKYDAIVLAQHGLTITPCSFDTMIAEWLIDPASHSLGLKDMADAYLNVGMTHIEELIGKGKAQISMAEVPVETAAPYAAADAEVTLRLKSVLQPRLAERNATHVFDEIEMPLLPVLMEMERAGIALDVPFLQQMSVELSQRLIELEVSVSKEVGYTFNLNSTQQLSKVLFDTLHLEPPDRRKRTASGHFSTSADVLEDLRGQHPVVDMVLEYRELAKLKSTYVDALPLEINPKTGRVHSSFSQTGSVTGRLASSDPNLQNIPTRTELGRRVRQGFVSGPQALLLSVDYSQIELRIVADMSGDQAMLAAFRANEDIHAATAAAIYNQPLDQVSKEQRRHAKAINFGLIYGMSAFGLSRTTDLTLAESEDFVKAYFLKFPGVKSYLDGMRKLAARQGYVETLLGRRRYFPNLRGQSNQNLRNREEREAINAPIQGTAADIIKLAMIRLPAALAAENLQSRLILQVHDELVLECPRDELLDAARVVQSVMENAYPLSIPLLTEARWGENWGNLQPIHTYTSAKGSQSG